MQQLQLEWNQEMISRWKARLTGRKETADQGLAVQALDLAGSALQKELTGDGTDLWDDLELMEKSSHITTAFRRIRIMALAYQSDFLEETYCREPLFEIIYGCLTRMKHYYRKDMELFGNWWDYDIGGAQALMDSLVLIFEKLASDQELLSHYLETVHTFVPVPRWAVRPYLEPLEMTGANLADTSLVCALRGLLEQEEEGMRQVQQAMAGLLPFVTSDDGFYEDGSYIQHHHIPYAGGYGPCLLDSFENIAYLLYGTPYSLSDLPDFSHTSHWILNAFLPFLRNGEMMDMVRGRKTSRSWEKAHDTGRMVMSTALLLADYQPEDMKDQIRRIIKGELERDLYERERLYQDLRPCQREAIRSLLSDTVEPAPQREEYRVYGHMDRVLIHRQEYAVGISMFSSRTGRFSFGNGENKKGYHACEGAVYLYTDDAGQYDNNYWLTVDPMRLPGITTDHSSTELVPWKDNRNSRTWAGGASLLSRYGSTGMEIELELPDSDLTGKKSWFAFEHGLVCMGAGICASTGDFVETIVENRRVEEEHFFADGEEIILEVGNENELCAKYMTLESQYLPISYYFPEEVPMTVKKEKRTGCWQDLNDGGSTELLSNTFVTLAISHGSRPEHGSYSYVVIPGKDHTWRADQSTDMAPWKILSNTEKIQAAQEPSTGLLGINFWEPGTLELTESLGWDGAVTAKQPCSVTMKKEQGNVFLGISDPTHQAAQVRLHLEGRYQVQGSSETIHVIEEVNGVTLVAATRQSGGRAHTIILNCEDMGSQVSFSVL